MADLITLGAGPLELDLWPDLGGSMVALRHAGVSLTQPLLPGWEAERSPSRLAGFACAPWFNRIPDGAFSFEGHDYLVPIDRPDLKAATHGFVRYRKPEARRTGHSTMSFNDSYAEPDSPYRYTSELRYALDPHGVTMALSVTNTGRRMPFAIGLHPFFRRTPGLTLTVSADGYLANDEGMLPSHWEPMGRYAGLLAGAVRDDLIGLNNSFTGWRQPARVSWNDLGLMAEVTAEASQPMLLHLFCPPDREILCLEPVTNVADVIHRRAFAKYADMTPLEPGERISMTMRIVVAAL